MSRKHKRPEHVVSPRKTQLWLWLGGLAVILIGLGIWLMIQPRSDTPPQVTGAPRLVVDQALIDEGDVRVNSRIQTAFRLKNVGDQPLRIIGEPQVELVEGC